MRDIDGSCKVWSSAAEPLDFVALSVCFLLSLLASLENEVQPRTAPTFVFWLIFIILILFILAKQGKFPRVTVDAKAK